MKEIIEVYHGGTDMIAQPIVGIGRPRLDFGPGFYITDIYEQAVNWALRQATASKRSPLLNVYLLDRAGIRSTAKCKIFLDYDEEWLDFIVESRNGEKPWEEYDYVEGGVADDRVIDTINLYTNGFIPKEAALDRLQYLRPNNQICLLNQGMAERYLKFIKCEAVAPSYLNIP